RFVILRKIRREQPQKIDNIGRAWSPIHHKWIAHKPENNPMLEGKRNNFEWSERFRYANEGRVTDKPLLDDCFCKTWNVENIHSRLSVLAPQCDVALVVIRDG